MPQLVIFIAAGAGLVAGYKWLARGRCSASRTLPLGARRSSARPRPAVRPVISVSPGMGTRPRKPTGPSADSCATPAWARKRPHPADEQRSGHADGDRDRDRADAVEQRIAEGVGEDVVLDTLARQHHPRGHARQQHTVAEQQHMHGDGADLDVGRQRHGRAEQRLADEGDAVVLGEVEPSPSASGARWLRGIRRAGSPRASPRRRARPRTGCA